jgi:hypothetical protein
MKAQQVSALMVVALWLCAGSSYAQEVASSFEQLRVLVRAGDTISVRDSTGTETTGRIRSLSSSSLLLIASSGTQRELKEADVTTILQRRSDPLANGALWGLVVGLAAGGIGAAAMCADGPCDGSVALVVPYVGGLAAAIGTGVDAMIIGRKVIYERRPGSARFGVRPLLVGGRRGAALSISF